MTYTKPSKANEGEFLLKPVENTSTRNHWLVIINNFLPVATTVDSKLDNHQDDSDSDSQPDFPLYVSFFFTQTPNLYVELFSGYRGKQVAQTVGDVQQNKVYTRPDNQVDGKEGEKLDELDQRAADDKKAKEKKGK